MKEYVIDTNITSFVLRSKSEAVLYQPYLKGATLYLSFQTVAELKQGALKDDWGPRRMQELEAYLSGLSVVHSSNALISQWASVMEDARRAGHRLEAADAWIAATARLYNIPLITHDKDFSPEACPSIEVICHAPE